MVLVDYIGFFFYTWQYFWLHTVHVKDTTVGLVLNNSYTMLYRVWLTDISFFTKCRNNLYQTNDCRVKVLMYNTTLINISVISWRPVFLVEETGVPGENHRPVASLWQTLSHLYCIEYTSPWAGFEFTTLVVICTVCIRSCTSNYHMITTITAVWLSE